MADFESKLRWLSERGDPVGAEELIERIEAELAGSPLVVVADRGADTLAAKPQDRPVAIQPSRSPGFAWAVGLVAAVVAVVGLNIVLTGNRNPVADPSVPTLATPDGASMTDLEVIEAGVQALYTGDADRAVELFEMPAPHDDAWIRTEAPYQAAIGGRLTAECTELADPDVFSCVVPYHNAFTDALGWVDSPGDEVRVSVVDGVITQFGFPVHSFLERGLAEFLAETGSGDPDCGFEHSIECAVLLMGDLDAWAAWAETNLELPSALTDLEIIERGVATLYFGDADWAVELFELDSPLCCDGLSGDEWIRETAAYQTAVGGRVTLDCVEQGAPGLFDCTVPYQNVFTDVIGWVDSPGETIRVAVENGVITEFDPYPAFIHVALKDFLQEQGTLREQGLVDLGDSRCSFSNGLSRLGWLTEGCVDFVLAHLDEWTAWAETNLGRPPVAMSSVIEAGVEAIYSGDADRAAELFELPDRDDDEIRRLAAYEAAIHGRLVLSCWERGFGQFDCFANYQNALTDAIGSGPPGDSLRAVVEAGVITEFYFPEHTYLMTSVADFLNQVQDDSACGREFFSIFRAEGDAPPTAGCVAVIMANLDDWAAWYRTNG